MHVFVIGATDCVGGAVADELLGAGHRVTGLARDAARLFAAVLASEALRPSTMR